MGRYRKIDPRIWNDEKFRALSEDGKLAFFFVLTHPSMTCLGAMRGTPEGLAAEQGWRPARMRKAIGESVTAVMIELNTAAAYIGAPNFLRYNEPEGPNSVTKAWVSALDLIPECPEKQNLLRRSREYLQAQSEAFRSKIGPGVWAALGTDADAIPDAIPDGKSNPCPIPEQEQEQEQEQKKNARAAAKISRARKRRGLPPDLKASCPLDVIAWAKSELGMDDRAIAYWHREWVEAVSAGRIKPSTNVRGWILSLKNSLQRQLGKRVPRPRPTSTSSRDLDAELAEREAAIDRERRDREAVPGRGQP